MKAYRKRHVERLCQSLAFGFLVYKSPGEVGGQDPEKVIRNVTGLVVEASGRILASPSADDGQQCRLSGLLCVCSFLTVADPRSQEHVS